MTNETAFRPLTSEEVEVIDGELESYRAMRDDPKSDWNAGPTVEREWLRGHELALLKVRHGEADPDAFPTVDPIERELRGIAIARHSMGYDKWMRAEQLRSRERSLLEQQAKERGTP